MLFRQGGLLLTRTPDPELVPTIGRGVIVLLKPSVVQNPVGKRGGGMIEGSDDLGRVASDRRKLQLVVASRSAEYGRRLCHLRGSKKEADPITIH